MPFPGNPRGSSPAGLALVLLGLIAIISIAGWVFYQSQEQQITTQITGDLTAVANLKSDQIVEWRKDRLFDADVISTGGFFADGADHFLTYGDAENRERILERFRLLNSSPDYLNVMLVDPQGTVRLSLDPAAPSPRPVRDQVARSLATGRSGLTDLYRSPVTGTPRMDVIAPLIVRNDSMDRPVGAVVFTVDPSRYLYSYIQKWPVPSASAETLLVERQDDRVVWLNNIRFRNDTALALTMPLDRTDVPAVAAVLGKTGIFTGNDYRDVPVVAVLAPIPGSPWFLVTKVDSAEAYGPWRTQSGLVIFLIFGTLAGAVVVTGFIWQLRQKYYYRALLAAESALREEEEKSRLALQAAGQRLRRFYDSGLFGVIFWNMEGKITDANDTFLSMTGYSRSDLEAGSIDWGDLTPPEFRDRDEEAVRELRAAGRNVPYEKEYLRKDGSRLPILIAGAMLDERRFDGVAFVLDISELRKARADSAAIARLYRNLFEHMLDGFAYCRMIYRDGRPWDFTYLAVNRAFGELTGLKDVETKNVSAVIPGIREADPGLLEIYGRVASTGVPERFEMFVESLKIWFSIAVYSPETGYFVAVFDVITERKRAEAALAESEERLRLAQEAANAGTWEWDLATNANYWSEKTFNLYGLDPRTTKASYETWLASILPPDREAAAGAVGTAAGQGLPIQVEWRVNLPENEKRWLMSRGQPVHDNAGKPVKYRGIVIDITDRKKAEAQREESTRQRQLALDAARLGWWYYNPVTKNSTYDERYREIFGVTGTGRPNEELLALLHPDDLPRVLAAVDAALDPADPKPYEIEYRVNAADGVTRWVRAHGIPAFEGSGPGRQAVSFVGTVEDITDRKKAEESVRETNEYLQNLINYANAPIIVWDPQIRITRFNHAFEHLTGMTEQEMLGKNLEVLFPEESRKSSLGLIRKALAGERWETVEIPVRHTAGSLRIVLWNSANITGPDGSVVATIAQGQDITDRKLTEQQREALIRELEQKNAELERFTYTISHDLKSPLITIKGFAGLLENDSLAGDPGQLLKDVRRITTAADTMEQLLSDVLELSRIGRIVAPPERVPFGRIVGEAVDLLAGPIAERRVTVEIASDLPDVNVDHVRIREVMTNLIENAVKYMGSQPDPRIRIGVSYDEGHPVFFVQDNGIGIERRYLDRIFNLFEKLDPKTPGTGVGLTIVKRIVEVHGGRIWAESGGPGTGTTFRFTLEGRGREGNRA